jgi:hypothetical protein
LPAATTCHHTFSASSWEIRTQINPPANVSDAEVIKVVDSLLATTQRIHQLEARSTISTKVLDAQPFADALHQHRYKELTGGSADVLLGKLVVFGFAEPTLDLRALAKSIIDPTLPAFYDPVGRQIVVRRPRTPGFSAADEGAIVHELARALHAQHMAATPKARAFEDDEVAAARALDQGAAEVVRAAFFAERDQKPPGELIARVAGIAAALPLDKTLQMQRHGAALALAPVLIRDAYVIPEADGLRLAAAIYKSGGFQLVNRALQHPPSTMEQVLHPEKYGSGEPATPVADPALPAHAKMLDGGHMGELGVRAYVGRCVAKDEAADAGTGWAGDRYVIVGEPGRLQLLWSTTWDSELAAARFEERLRTQPSSGSSPSPVGLKRKRASVAVVRGVGAPDGDIDALLALAGPSPKRAPPLGGIDLKFDEPGERVVPAMVATEGVGHSKLIGDRFVNPVVGLTGQVPSTFSGTVNQGSLFDIQRSSPSRALGSISFERSNRSIINEAEFFNMASAATATRILQGRRLTEEAVGELKLPMGTARYRTYGVDGTVVKLRLVAVPACDKRAAFIIILFWTDSDGEVALQEWVANLATKTSVPACKR